MMKLTKLLTNGASTLQYALGLDRDGKELRFRFLVGTDLESGLITEIKIMVFQLDVFQQSSLLKECHVTMYRNSVILLQDDIHPVYFIRNFGSIWHAIVLNFLVFDAKCFLKNC